MREDRSRQPIRIAEYIAPIKFIERWKILTSIFHLSFRARQEIRECGSSSGVEKPAFLSHQPNSRFLDNAL